MCKERMQVYYRVRRIFYDRKYDKNFYVIDISFATLEFEYYVLILLQKRDVGSYKMEISKK